MSRLPRHVPKGVDLKSVVVPSELVHRLVREIEQVDACTAAHTWRVVFYIRAICEAAGLDNELIEHATVGAALHDVGKLDIPVEILRKPARLTDEEFAVIKKHPIFGYERLTALGVKDPVVLNLVRFHHERIDGLGYPDGLKGEDIPIGARYFAVIDTFDAMTSIRPYRSEVGAEAAEKAIEEINAGVGSRYCAEAVNFFTDLYRRGDLEWILHYYNDESSVPAFESNVAVRVSDTKRAPDQ